MTAATAAELRRSDGPTYGAFINGLCRVTKDSVGGRRGELIVLRPFQQLLLDHLLARRRDGRRRFRQALIGTPRKNTKSTLGSGIALAGLYTGPGGSEVYSCAGDKEQARIVFGTAKAMVEMEPELLELAVLYRDAIEIPGTGSVYRCLSSVAELKEGLNPNLVVFDEVHVQPDDDLWNVMTEGLGARFDPLVAGITTAGNTRDRRGDDTLCYRLYQHGVRLARRELRDPSFFFGWWEPRLGMKADHRDPAVWREANPGFGDLVDPEDLAAAAVDRHPGAELDFRTKRLNIWNPTSTAAWLPYGAWEACEVDRPPPAAGEAVCLGFDGSHSRDSTALVGCTLGGGHIFVVHVWERPVGGARGWRVPRGEVQEAIRRACRRWRVVELGYDPYRWADLMEELGAEGVPVVEVPQNGRRMAPLCEAFAAAVLDRRLTQDGNSVLTRHIANAVTYSDFAGTRIVKESQDSERTIDGAVAAVIARARAAHYGTTSSTRATVHTWPDDDELAELLAEGDRGG